MTTSQQILNRVATWPDHCEAGVTRNSEFVPCDKPAIAVRLNDDDELAPANSYGWPVCAHHARTGRLMPLRDLLAWHGRLATTNPHTVTAGADA